MAREDVWIGKRVAKYRSVKNMTQRQLADAIGVDPSLISHIEAGRKAVVKRSMLIQLADALSVTPMHLIDQPLPVVTRDDLLTVSSVAGIRAALDYPDDPPQPRTRHELTIATDQMLLARMQCDYGALSAGLPGLLAEARAEYATAGQPWAGRLLVRATVCASLTLRPIGWQDLAMRLAELAQRTAAEIGDGDLFAASEFVYAQCLLSSGSRKRSLQVATAAAEATPVDEPGARVMAGMLRLHAALSASSLSDLDAAEGHFAEAEALARVAVDNDPWLMEFGPDNINTWRVGATLENGHPQDAPVIASRVTLTNLKTRQRRCRLLMDTGRGLYLSEQPDRAVRAFLRAATIAPDEVRTRPSIIEIVGQMRRDARNGGSDELRRLAELTGTAA